MRSTTRSFDMMNVNRMSVLLSVDGHYGLEGGESEFIKLLRPQAPRTLSIFLPFYCAVFVSGVTAVVCGWVNQTL